MRCVKCGLSVLLIMGIGVFLLCARAGEPIVIGPTYPIVEKDMLQVLKGRLVSFPEPVPRAELKTVSSACPAYAVSTHLLSDFCLECIFPIAIGPVKQGSVHLPDTDPNTEMFCLCHQGIIPTMGLRMSYWEPIGIVEVTRTPGCFPNLWGMQLPFDRKKIAGVDQPGGSLSSSFYHVHYYTYPILSRLMPQFFDGSCHTKEDFDLLYTSEGDATWSDAIASNRLFPESTVFADPLRAVMGEAACSTDALSAEIGLPIDKLYYCAGSQGFMYPLTGFVSAHTSFVQAATLLAERVVFKLHRLGRISDTDSHHVCGTHIDWLMKKSRYRYQMLYPIHQPICAPFGRSTLTWNKNNRRLHDMSKIGDVAVFLIWRKKNCCVF